MTKKIIAIALLAGLILTGCTTPDVVIDKVKASDMGVLESAKDIKALEKTKNQKAKKEDVTWTNSQAGIKQLQTWISTVKSNKWLKKKSVYVDDLSADDVDDLIQNIMVEFEFSGADRDQELDYFYKQLEKLGYSGLSDRWEMIKDDELDNTICIVSEGVAINMIRDDIYTITDVSEEHNTMWVDVTHSAARCYYPEEYADIVEACGSDGFYVGQVTAGGSWGSIYLAGSCNDPMTTYDKNIMIYLEHGVPVQAEIEFSRLDDVREDKSRELFTADELTSLYNLLQIICGVDGERFFGDLALDHNDRGTVGTKEWYLTKESQLSTGGKGYLLKIL